MTTIDITLFMSMKDIKKSGETELDFNDQQTAITFNQACSTAHAIKGMPRYWGFASYQDKHNQASLIANPPIVLEYAYAQRQPLIDRLTELGLNALIFNADRAQQATVVAVLPLAKAIVIEKEFTRAATVVADMIGLYDLLDGKSNTFLVQPAQFPKAQLLVGKALSAYHLNRDGWLEFKDWQQPKPVIRAEITSRIDADGALAARITNTGAPITPTKSQQIAAQFRVLADLFDKEGN